MSLIEVTRTAATPAILGWQLTHHVYATRQAYDFLTAPDKGFCLLTEPPELRRTSRD